MRSRAPRRESIQASTTLTAVVLAAVIIVGLYWAQAVGIPLALAILVTFVLSPAVTTLRRYGLPRVPAVILVLLSSLTIVLALVALISWQFGALVQELPDHQDRISGKLATVRGWVDGNGRLAALLKEIESALQPKLHPAEVAPMPVEVVSPSHGWLAAAESLIGPAAESLARAVLTVVLVGFLLFSKEDMRNRMLRLIGPRRLTATTKAVDDAGLRISRYLRMQLFINAAFGLVLALALLALGVRYAILWGFSAAILRYIPYVGAWFGLIPPVLAALAMSDGAGQLIGILIVYTLLELVVSQILEPRLFGQSLGLSEVAQIVSAAFWAFLWGPIGLILSGPLTACLLVLGKSVPRLQWLDVLLGDEEALSPPMTLFQRLAARDRDEVWRLVTAFAESNSPPRAVDDLIVPALVLTQEAVDRRELSDDDAEWIVETLSDIVDETVPPVEPDAADADFDSAPLLLAPAGSPGDSLALELLERQLDSQHWEVRRLSDDVLASDVLAAVAEFRPSAIVLGTLAGGEMTQVRYLCKRLRAAHPEVRLLVGRWGREAITAELRNDINRIGVDEIVTSISAMAGLLKSQHSVFLATSAEPAKSSRRAAPFGTASAPV